MFQSYQYIKHLNYDQKIFYQYIWEYKIIDSEFEEVGHARFATPVERLGSPGFVIEVAAAVINTYEKRLLSVSINLALAFKYIHDQFGTGLEYMVSWNRKHNLKYKQYDQETERCLQRLNDLKVLW